MAGVAINGHLPLGVTVEASLHVKRNRWPGDRDAAVLDVSVTSGAVDTAQGHMPPVGKVDVARDPVHLLPGNFNPLFRVLSDFFFFGALGEGSPVAHHAVIGPRQRGVSRLLDGLVT